MENLSATGILPVLWFFENPIGFALHLGNIPTSAYFTKCLTSSLLIHIFRNYEYVVFGVVSNSMKVFHNIDINYVQILDFTIFTEESKNEYLRISIPARKIHFYPDRI